MIKHLFCQTIADPVPHQNHYFLNYLVLVSLILSNLHCQIKMVVLEIGIAPNPFSGSTTLYIDNPAGDAFQVSETERRQTAKVSLLTLAAVVELADHACA